MFTRKTTERTKTREKPTTQKLAHTVIIIILCSGCVCVCSIVERQREAVDLCRRVSVIVDVDVVIVTKTRARIIGIIMSVRAEEINRYPSSDECYENDKTDHQNRVKMRRKKKKAEFLALEQHRMMGTTTTSNRKVDKPLVCVAALILCLVIFVELKTSPRKIARRAMESVEHLFHYMEKGGEMHAQMLRWRGWHSLEVGVEIACALTLAFLNWLLFASLFDVAGIVVGLIPAMATFLGVLVFRFHARSYFVLALIPLVVVPAIGCAKLLERRMRVKEERRMKARKERRREQRMARETRHQNGFVANDNNNNNMNNSEDPTRASGRTTIDATVMRRAMSQGELSPTTRVVSSSGMNPSLSAAAANGTTIKGFNALSNGNGGGKAAPIMPAKVNALAGQPRHARGSSAPELGFNQLSSSSSSSSSLQRQQQQQPGEGAQNTAAGPQPTPSPYFGANIPDLGGVEQNALPVPKLQNPLPFANATTANVAGGAGGGGGGGGGEGPNRPTTNLLNVNPSRTAKRFNVRKPNLETIHSPLGTASTGANVGEEEILGRAGSHQWENDDQLKTKVEESNNIDALQNDKNENDINDTKDRNDAV